MHILVPTTTNNGDNMIINVRLKPFILPVSKFSYRSPGNSYILLIVYVSSLRIYDILLCRYQRQSNVLDSLDNVNHTNSNQHLDRNCLCLNQRLLINLCDYILYLAQLSKLHEAYQSLLLSFGLLLAYLLSFQRIPSKKV